MKKNIVIIGIVTLIIAFVLFGLMWMMGAPMYRAGHMKTRKDIEAFVTPPPQTGVPAGFFRVEKAIDLYYFTAGISNGIPALVVHGGPGYPEDKPWTGLKSFENKYHFIYYHQRGCGKSTRPVEKLTSGNFYKDMMELTGKLGLDQQVTDIERIRRILGVEKIVLIGHSFGGFLAALYAAEFP